MKYSLSLKKQVIEFRSHHTWLETKQAFPDINDETWRIWWNKRDSILNQSDISPEEKARLQTERNKEIRHQYRQKHPFSELKEKHIFVVCCYRTNNDTKRRREPIAGDVKITPFDLWKIAKKQKLICPLTGIKLNSDNISVDHIVPLANHGIHHPSNLRLVHKDINRMKNHFSDEYFIKFCHLVSFHNERNIQIYSHQYPQP